MDARVKSAFTRVFRRAMPAHDKPGQWRTARRDMSFVGRSVTRLEDRLLVTGRGAFAADIACPHMLHMRVVRSGHSHGRIMSVDASAGLAIAGVAALWTSAAVSEVPPIDFRLTRIEGLA